MGHGADYAVMFKFIKEFPSIQNSIIQKQEGNMGQF